MPYGLNGNKRFYTMTDKKYRQLAKIAFDLQEYFIDVATEEYHEGVKHTTWLMLIGLMETWDMIK